MRHTDHKHAANLTCTTAHRTAFFDGSSHGLFNKHMLTARERIQASRGVKTGWRTDNDGVDIQPEQVAVI